MRTSRLLISSMFVLALGMALVSCKSTGQGMGESHSGDIKATFTWEQSAPTSGTLRATVTKPGSAPETYEGKFYQITRDTRIDTIADVWSPWYPGWRDWAFWGPEPEESFVANYTGHVVANLAGPGRTAHALPVPTPALRQWDEGRRPGTMSAPLGSDH